MGVAENQRGCRRASLFTARVAPAAAWAILTVLTACQPDKIAPADPDAVAAWEAAMQDAGREPPGPVPTTPVSASPNEGGADEQTPPVASVDPTTAIDGQSGGAAAPATPPTNPCSGDAGPCASGADAGPPPVVCVPTGLRDCTSALDNDCDGQLDNVVDDVCQCVPGTIEVCDEHPGFDGLGSCVAGSRACVAGEGNATSAFGECSGGVAPAAEDICAPGDDSNCNGVPNEGCICVEGETQACGSTTDTGVCQIGSTTCVNGAFGACEGAVPPAARDTCARGDDSNCNGMPNEGCTCVDGDTRPCGQDVGACQAGTQTCTNGTFGQCVGAIGPAQRDCTSANDNDCDGRADSTLDNVCRCVIGTTQACNVHPQDGIGICRPGQQTCSPGANGSSTAFGECTGGVGPAEADLCDGTDTNCNGVADDDCLQPLATGEACENDTQCSSGSCVAFYVDADNDGFAASVAGMDRLCATATFFPERRTRTEPTNIGNTDCGPDAFDVRPSQEGFFLIPIPGRSASDPLAFDYNCDGDPEFRYRDDYERSISPGGFPTCGFAPFDVCQGGRIWQQSTTCGEDSFVEICGDVLPQDSFPDLGCTAGRIEAETVACR